MSTARTGPHRTHPVLLWVALLGALFAVSAFGLIVGTVFARPPADPIARATPTPGQGFRPTPSPSLGPPLAIASLTLHPPEGWQVTEKKDTSIEFTDADGRGVVFLQSDRRQPAEPAGQILTDITASTQRKYPDVRPCLLPAALLLSGRAGSVYALCYTFIPQSGRAYPATDLFWVATNPNGSVFYLYEVFAPSDQFNDFNRRADALVRTVAWRYT